MHTLGLDKTDNHSLGEAQASDGIVYNQGEDVDAEPVAEFLFKYRTTSESPSGRMKYLTPFRLTQEAAGHPTYTKSQAPGTQAFG